ncbi:MAG: helix-turn-helix domain-containing protein [Solobacterium sp.]|nr:helix-turn-helix domain-containing protein [Solobacterium sp.]
MELKEIIRDYKNKTGMNDSDIARRVGVTRSTASRWSSGKVRHVSGETLSRLSELIGYNIEPLLKGMDITMKIPVLGYVKAGYNLFAEENWLGEEEVSLAEKKTGDFFLQVTGDSMNGAGILDGSLVLVRQSDTIDSGKIGVVLIGDEVTVKRVIYKNGMMILEAANPEVENRYFTAKEIRSVPVRILGRVVSCKTYF